MDDGKQVESDNIEDEQRWNDHGGTAEEVDAAAAEDAAAQTDDPSRCERVRIRRQRRREDKSIARACGGGFCFTCGRWRVRCGCGGCRWRR